MNQLHLLAERELVGNKKRYGPAFSFVVAVIILLIGISNLRSGRFTGKATLLSGSKEYSGGIAIIRGIMFCIIGAAMIVGGIVMYNTGRTML